MRLEGKIKAGYYPTPERVTEIIKTYLKPKGGLIRVYDPCCGYGTAIKVIAGHLGAESYGVELEKERAEGAKEILTEALQADTFRVKARKHSFSLLFLNPPYDHDEGERTEHRFLLETNDYLMPEGILAYLIPKHRLYKRTARVLANWYTSVRVYHFPDPEVLDFNQIVLFARKKAKCNLDSGLYQELLDIPDTDLPPLSDQDLAIYEVPPVPDNAPFYFRKLDLSPEELAEEVRQFGIWKEFYERIIPDIQKARVRPAMPLRKGHIAILVAAGLTDGVLEKDGEKVLIKGTVKKEQIITQEAAENCTIQRSTDVLTIVVKALDLNTGNIITIR